MLTRWHQSCTNVFHETAFTVRGVDKIELSEALAGLICILLPIFKVGPSEMNINRLDGC